MRLSQELFLGIAGLLVAALASAFALSVGTTQRFVTEQLASHSQDAATSLGLSLGAMLLDDDRGVAERVVDAMFDRGYYADIEVLDVSGAVVIRRTLEPAFEDVPAWFTALVLIEAPAGESFITTRWRQAGKVVVRSHPGHAYRQLWRMTLSLTAVFAGTLLLSLAVVALLLRAILVPLRRIEAQARSISNRAFETIALRPREPELRAVVDAMNQMATRLHELFDEQGALIERYRRDATIDEVTGLLNRREFEQRLRHALADREAVHAALVLILSVEDLSAFNDRHGVRAADEVLASVAGLLAAGFGERAVAGRLRGASFVLAGPGLTLTEARAATEDLHKRLLALFESDPALAPLRFSIGALFAQQDPDYARVMSACDGLLAAAHARERNAMVFEAQRPEGGVPVMGAGQWREVLREALAEGRLQLFAQPAVILRDGRELLREVTTRVLDAQGRSLPAGQYLPMAERHGLMPDIDRAALGMLARASAAAGGEVRWAVNLSSSTLRAAGFLGWLGTFLEGVPALARRLTFEIDEFVVAAYGAEVRALAAMLNPFGARIALDRFVGNHGSLRFLRTLRPEYLKIDGSLVRGVEANEPNRFFVQSMVGICRPLDIAVIALWVEHAAERDALAAVGVTAVQGFLTGAPAAVALPGR